MSSKKTLAGRQKQAVFIALAAILLLVIALFVVRYLVSIYEFVDADGTEYTVKRQDGVYGLFDKSGNRMSTTVEDGKKYFVTEAGTLVSVSESGGTSVYAVVDTEGGEIASEYNRLMIFPKIETAQIRSIRVTNEHGTFTFARTKSGNMAIQGYESVAYSREAYSYLSSLCGSMVVMNGGRYTAEVIDTYGLEEYGLDEPQATFTITSAAGKSYTVLVGDMIVSGNGYYVMLEGRETVYIVNAYYSVLLNAVESYVEPALIYGMDVNNYPEVQNFRVYRYTYDEEEKPSASLITALSYWPYEERENTEYQTQAYRMIEESLAAYVPESNSVTSTMQKLIELEKAKVVKLGVTDKALADCGLNKPETLLSYDFEARSGNQMLRLSTRIWFSSLTERGTHYAYVEAEITDGVSRMPVTAFDYILEIDVSALPFLSWGKIDWVEIYYFHINIMLLEQVEITLPTGTMTLDFKVGEDDVERIVATLNGESKDINVAEFKKIYIQMLYGVLFDEADKTDEELEALVKDESKHQLSYRVKTRKTDKTEGIDNTYSFYYLAETDSYLTINGGGEFYVLSNAVKQLAADAVKLWEGVVIDR